jgi:hypothetical protein
MVILQPEQKKNLLLCQAIGKTICETYWKIKFEKRNVLLRTHLLT